jgi:HTH-type transcriptional regulator/antitoxin HigA
MDIKAIRTNKDYRQALASIDALLAKKRLSATEDNALEALGILVAAYEERVFPMPKLDPIEFLQAHMENSGRTQSDLAALIGSPLASLILNRRRAMSLDVIRRISAAWHVPIELLISEYALEKRSA